MKRGLKVYLFRHGESFFNKDEFFTGWKDSKLTEKGKRDARKIARILKNKKIDAAFRTSLSRSKDTLKEVLKFHPECKKIIIDDRMIERGYGKLEGRSHEKIKEEYGEEQFEKWHRGFNERPPGGESFADVEKRVKKFIAKLKNYMRKNNFNVVVSAHGNSLRLFRKIMERASIKKSVSWTIPYDRVFEYKI